MSTFLLAHAVALPLVVLLFKWVLDCLEPDNPHNTWRRAIFSVSVVVAGLLVALWWMGHLQSGTPRMLTVLAYGALALLLAGVAVRFVYKLELKRTAAVAVAIPGAWLLALQATFVTAATVHGFFVASPAVTSATLLFFGFVLWSLRRHYARIERNWAQLTSWLGI